MFWSKLESVSCRELPDSAQKGPKEPIVFRQMMNLWRPTVDGVTDVQARCLDNTQGWASRTWKWAAELENSCKQTGGRATLN